MALPAALEKRKKERDRDRGQEGERETERRCVKICRCEDVKMRRLNFKVEDMKLIYVDVRSRWEDV